MKILSFFAVLFFQFSFCFAQSLTWCPPGAKWTVRQTTVGYCSTIWDSPMIDYYYYTYLGDSMINGVHYKHIFGKHTSWGDTSLFGRIEGNKAILLNIPHTTNIPEEVLLVDYGWNIGDTVDNYYFQSALQPFPPDYDDKRWVIDAGVEYL